MGPALPAHRPDAAAIAADAQRLLAVPCYTRPVPGQGTAAEAFLDRVVSPAVAAPADRVGTLAELPDVVRRYLAANKLAPSVALQPHPWLQAL